MRSAEFQGDWGPDEGLAPSAPPRLSAQLHLLGLTKVRMLLREFWREVRTTPQGKVVVLLFATAPFFGADLLINARAFFRMVPGLAVKRLVLVVPDRARLVPAPPYL